MSYTVDYRAIAAALALRFSAANVTAPTGEPAIRSSTYAIPAGIHPPCVVVFPPEESDIQMHPGMMVTSAQMWTVRFYLASPADYAREAARMLDWLSAIYGSLDGQVELGLSYVSKAVIKGHRRGNFPYGAEGIAATVGYPGWDLFVEVLIHDARSFVA